MNNQPTTADTGATDLGRRHGRAAGSWIVDGNTTTDTMIKIIEGYDEGDPVIMDLMPAPLSGEWAGESIRELFGLPIGSELPDDETLDSYESAYSEAFWDEVIKSCRAGLGLDDA